jgi:OOP family OmpA-OmpF porin
VGAAKRIKARFGDAICIYTVLVGSEKPDRVKVMQEIAAASNCGFYQNANNLESPEAMAAWVTSVFLEKAPTTAAAPKDSDGDGVIDSLDKCPSTPQGAAVDKVGCPLDSDSDGVYDYRDQCPGTPEGAKVNELGCWILGGVLFDTGKWTIKPQAYPELDEIVAVLKNNPALNVEIQGHTDNRGSAEMNQALSEKRANAVMDYLVKMGIQPQRLAAAGYGFSKPVASNETAKGRALNRRVELKPSR